MCYQLTAVLLITSGFCIGQLQGIADECITGEKIVLPCSDVTTPTNQMFIPVNGSVLTDGANGCICDFTVVDAPDNTTFNDITISVVKQNKSCGYKVIYETGYIDCEKMNSFVSNNLSMHTAVAFTRDNTDSLSATEGFCLNVITSNENVTVTKTCYKINSTLTASMTSRTNQQLATSTPVKPSTTTTISAALTPSITTLSPSFSSSSPSPHQESTTAISKTTPIKPSTTTTISVALTPSITTLSPSFSSSSPSPHQESTTAISKSLTLSITTKSLLVDISASSVPLPPSSLSSPSSHATTIKSSSVEQEYTRTQLVPAATTPTYDQSEPSDSLAILVYGITGGVACLCLLIIVIVILCICNQRHKNDHYTPSETPEDNHNSNNVPAKVEMNTPENNLDVSQGEYQPSSVGNESQENNPVFRSTHSNDAVIIEPDSDVLSPTSNPQGASGDINHDNHPINGMANQE